MAARGIGLTVVALVFATAGCGTAQRTVPVAAATSAVVGYENARITANERARSVEQARRLLSPYAGKRLTAVYARVSQQLRVGGTSSSGSVSVLDIHVVSFDPRARRYLIRACLDTHRLVIRQDGLMSGDKSLVRARALYVVERAADGRWKVDAERNVRLVRSCA